MFRTIPNSLVLYPTDAVSAERAVELAVNYHGIVYIKGGRANHPILYSNEEIFEAGKAKVLKQSNSDKLTIVSGGATLFEALKVYEKLSKEGINVRLVDIFSVKPIDKETLIESAKATNGLVYVVEDHYPEGGIGEAVMHALKGERNTQVFHRAVNDIPRSGTPEELYDLFGLSADKVYVEVSQILKENK